MRAIVLTLLLLGSVSPGFGASVAPAKILKVLPHYLDPQGRHTLSPSLYDRDAYQAKLRKTPAARTALRFDVQWKARGTAPLKLRVELRGAAGKVPTTAVLEEPAKFSRWFSQWSAVTLKGDDYKKFGELTGWRATLWRDGELLAEQKSFLW